MCTYDAPTVRVIEYPHLVTARKEHVCSYCELPIYKGERYTCARYIMEGNPYAWREHPECEKMIAVLCEEELNHGGHPVEGELREYDNDSLMAAAISVHENWREAASKRAALVAEDRRME